MLMMPDGLFQKVTKIWRNNFQGFPASINLRFDVISSALPLIYFKAVNCGLTES
jgi:hypothetical protein